METENSLDRFTLDNVKLLPNGGLFAKWEMIKVNGAITDVDLDDKSSTREPHPDLVAIIESLKPFLSKMHGADYAVIVAESKEFGASPKQIDAMKRAYIEKLKDIVVTGITIKGKGAKIAVVITGKRKLYKKIFTPMGSSRIQLNQKLYGFENDIEDMIPDIISEVYKYLFEGKCANPTLFEPRDSSEINKKPDGQQELPKDSKELKEPVKKTTGSKVPQKQEVTE